MVSTPVAVAVFVGALAFVAVGLRVLLGVIRKWAEVWNSVLEPLGGVAQPKLGLNSVLTATVPLDRGATLHLDQWKGGGSMRYGQIVATVNLATSGLDPFALGAGGLCAAFSRWALNLPLSDSTLPSPLTELRGQLPPAWRSQPPPRGSLRFGPILSGGETRGSVFIFLEELRDRTRRHFSAE